MSNTALIKIIDDPKTGKKRMKHVRDLTDKEESELILMDKFLSALESEKGVVTWASNRTGIPVQKHHQWLNKFPEYAERAAEIEKVNKDWIFSKLAELIDEKNPQSVIFACKTRLGMTEKTETTVNVKAKDLIDVDDALAEMRESLKKSDDLDESSDSE